MDKFLKHAVVSYRSHIIMLLVYIGFTVLAYFIMRQTITENFTNLGKEVAQFYKMEEEKSFTYHKHILTHLVSILDGTNRDNKALFNLEDVFTTLVNSSIKNDFEPYAIINGELVTGRKKGDVKEVISEDIHWYNNIKKVQDGFVISDVYIDEYTHEPTITVAKFMENSKDMVAVDISVKNYIPPIKNAFLPPKSNYYLFGVSGNLFYYDDDLGLSEEGIANNAKTLYDIVVNTDSKDKDLSYIDANGLKKFVFFDRTKDNLVVIVTIPYEYLVSRLDQLLYAAAAFLAAIALITIINIVLSYTANRNSSKLSEILTFLGDIYYAIMLVDLEKENYIVVKAPKRLSNVLKSYNPYSHLLEVIQAKMEKSVAESFAKAFSIENIHKIAEKGVREFGGEFKTVLEDQTSWISVRLFLDHNESNHNVIICCKEVTREKEQEVRQYELLKSAVENAKKSEKSRNDFFARMSHDMRTPLNGIIGYTELGMNHAFSIEETKEYLNKIKGS